jgi:hypothetical protein
MRLEQKHNVSQTFPLDPISSQPTVTVRQRLCRQCARVGQLLAVVVDTEALAGDGVTLERLERASSIVAFGHECACHRDYLERVATLLFTS